MPQISDTLRNKIKLGEGLNLDFKHSIKDTKKIARSLVAFANTEGGSLLIGVRDNGSIAGVNSEEEYYMIETASLLYTKPNVKIEKKNWIIDGKNILEIIVPKSTIKPHYAPDSNGVYKPFIRVKDENFIAHKIIVDTWKRKQKGFTGVKIIYNDVLETLLNEIQNNGSITKSILVNITGIKSSKANLLPTNLMLMEILDVDISENVTKFVFHKNYIKNFKI